MKRGTPDHPKVSVLMQVLVCERATAVGLLELLWHFTARYAPRGDIGRWTDDRIAAWLGWTGEPSAIVSALIHSGWLDVHPSFRLVVHDWHDHADDTTRKHLKRHRLTFISKVRRVSGQVQTFPDNTHQRRPAVAVAVAVAKPEPEPQPEPYTPPTGAAGGRALEAPPRGNGRPPAQAAHPIPLDPDLAELLDYDPGRTIEAQVVKRCLDLASKLAAMELRGRTKGDVRDALAAMTGTKRGVVMRRIRGADVAWLEASLRQADVFEAEFFTGEPADPLDAELPSEEAQPPPDDDEGPPF